MLSLHVSVPVACFRKGMAREYLETEPLPPPATCYGMLLSFVGQTDRRRHVGARVTAGLLNETETSVVLRTVWRVKSKPLGSSGNTRPDYQQLLTGATDEQPFIHLVIHLDSTEEARPASADGRGTLEQEVAKALDPIRRHEIHRFGGLSLGESTHMVDSVSILTEKTIQDFRFDHQRVFLKNDEGLMSLPVWVDHVGSANTRHVVGDLIDQPGVAAPAPSQIPMIHPDGSDHLV